MPNLRSGTATEETREEGSRQLSTGTTPPIWENLDEAGWLTFKSKFEHYSKTTEVSEPKKWFQCMTSQLTRQLQRLTKKQLVGGTTLPEGTPEGAKLMKELTWEEADKAISKVLAPHTHASAVGMLGRIKMERTEDPIKFTRTCLDFIDEFEQAYDLAKGHEGLEIDEKQLVKTFIAGITSVGVRERLRGMQPESCEQAYDKLMELAELVKIAAENADLFKGRKEKTAKTSKSEKREEASEEKKNEKFTGECYRCGRKGHKEAECIAKKHSKTGTLLLTEQGKFQIGNEEKTNTEFMETKKSKILNETSATPITYASITAGRHKTATITSLENSKIFEQPEKSPKNDSAEILVVLNARNQPAAETPPSARASAIADTGASDNFIDSEFLKENPKLLVGRQRKKKCRFRMANGYIFTQGSATLRVKQVKIKNRQPIPVDEEAVFHIIEDLPYNCVLGRGFLQTTELISGPLFSKDQPTRNHANTTETRGEEGYVEETGRNVPYDPETLAHIPAKHRQRFVKLTQSYSDLYGNIRKPANYPPVKIHFKKGERVPQQAMPRVADTQLPEVRSKLQEMIDLGVLERSTSPASSRFLMVRKPDNSYRLTVDLRELNDKCQSIKETMPTTREILVQAKGAKLFCTLDMTKFFYQLELEPASRYLTAMSTPIGKLQFKRLPMGFKNSPAIGAAALQQLLNLHPKGPGRGSCSYVDDILIYANDYEELYDELQEVLQKIREAGLKLSKGKARLAVPNVEFVGHELSAEGTALRQSRTQGVEALKAPRTKKEARSFCGIMNYSREYIQDMSRILKPIYEVIGSTAKFVWGERQETAFRKAKIGFLNATPLSWWEADKRTILETDASEVGIGAVLYQVDKQGKKYTLGFYSEAFNSTQSRWSTIEQEGYGIWKAVTHWHHILYGRPFTVRTDHANLRYMERSVNKKVGRWWTSLTNYDMIIEHTPGKENEVADGLSRLPDTDTTEKESDEQTEKGPTFLFAENQENEETEKNQKIKENRCETKNVKTQEGETERSEVYKDKTQPTPYNTDETLETTFQRSHNAMVGHMGIEETTRRMQIELPEERNLTRWVRERIRSCSWCQKDRTQAPKVFPQLNVLSTTEPFVSISIDTIGPLPEDEDGNKYIIAVIDDFTRYCELFPAPDTTAQSAARALVSVTGRYGRVSHVRSDGGSQYINDIIDKLKEILGLQHTRSWPYHPQANGKVERSIQEITRHLRALVSTLKIARRWSSVLPMVGRICNATPNRKIGMAPSEILYGKAVDLDRDMVQEPCDNSTNERHYPQLARDLKRSQERLIAKAVEVQTKEDERYLAKSPAEPTSFDTGTLVLAQHVNNKKPNKLASNWEGPLKILKKDGKNYLCTHLATGKEARYDITRLREYIDDDLVDDIEVASFDNQEDIVKGIKDHRLKKGKKESTKGSWEFEVVWTDNDKEWLNYHDVKNTEAFERYVQSKGIKLFQTKQISNGEVSQ